MGLLKHLLFWPVTAPKFLIDFSMGQVEGVVRQELTDDTGVKAELMELQLLLELGDIDDDGYMRREAELMLRLREIRDWRERLGMGVAGGLVRVAGSGTADQREMVEEDAAAPAPAAATPEATAEPPEPPDEEGKRPEVADPGSATVDFHLGWD
jgi:hypothetical protein